MYFLFSPIRQGLYFFFFFTFFHPKIRTIHSEQIRISKQDLKSDFLVMPSSRPHNSTSGNRRAGRHPASVRALTNLELRRQLVTIRQGALNRLVSEQSTVSIPRARGSSAALAGGSNGSGDGSGMAGSRAETGPAPGQARDRRNGWSGTASPVPAPLNPRRRPTRLPTRLPTSPPPYRNDPLPPTSNGSRSAAGAATGPITTDIPVTFALMRSMQHEAEVEIAMLDLAIELQHFRDWCD